METKKLILTVPPCAYQDALDAQSACNLSGIVHSLHRIVSEIWQEARANNLGTDYVNTHPICRLYAEQILFLSGGGCSTDGDTYSAAFKLCEERAAIDKPDEI